MQNLDHAGYYLRETWPRRVTDAFFSLVMLAFSAAALGVTITAVLRAVMLMQAGPLAWPLMAYLVLAVLGGIATVQFARIFTQLAGHALSVTPETHAAMPTGAVSVGSTLRGSV
jgi:hypothetical protein